MHIANQQAKIQDEALIGAITSTVHRSRRLGSNDAKADLIYVNELEFSMSGNVGLQWREDVPDRCRFIRLPYYDEHANSRVFSRPDLHRFVKDNREQILSAVYSLIMHWKKGGCIKGSVFTSFSRWAEVVGGILIVCGLGDPCLPTNFGGMDVGGDVLGDAMREVFREGADRFNGKWIDASAVRSLVEGASAASNHWNGLETPKDKKDFSRDLKKYDRRTLDGVTLKWEKPTEKLDRNRVVFTSRIKEEEQKTSTTEPENPVSSSENPVSRCDGGSTSESNEKPNSTCGFPENPSSTCGFPGNHVQSVQNVHETQLSGVFENNLKSEIERIEESKIAQPYREAGQVGRSGHNIDENCCIYITDADTLQNAISSLSGTLFLDIETYGKPPKTVGKKKVVDPLGLPALDPLRGSIRLLTIKSETSPTYTIDLDKVVFTPDLKSLIENSEIVGHNLFFDLAFLKARYSVQIAKKLYDVFLAAKVLTNGEKVKKGSHDLKAVIKACLGIDIEKTEAKSDWSSPELTEEQLQYSAEDVAYLPELKEVLEKVIEEENLTHIVQLENDLLPVIIDLYLDGFACDKEALQAMLTDALVKEEDAIKKLRAELQSPELNPNSTKQLLNAFALIGHPLPNTNESTRAHPEYCKLPAIIALDEYRDIKSGSVEKMESYIKAIRPNGRVHTRYKQLGAETGRLSATEPNVQQISRIDKSPIRRAFKVPKGRKLIKLDYAGMELRAAAHHLQEPALLKAFLSIDPKEKALHVQMAMEIFKLSYEDAISKKPLGKATNFGFLYLQGAAGFKDKLKEKEGVDITIEEATLFKQAYYRKYPKIKKWHDDTWKAVKTTVVDEVFTLFGRRQLIDPFAKEWIKATALVNTPIQGSCADAFKQSMVKLYHALKAHPEGSPIIVANIHDGIFIECDEDQSEEVCNLAKGIMEQTAGKMFPTVPMEVEPKIDDVWEK